MMKRLAVPAAVIVLTAWATGQTVQQKPEQWTLLKCGALIDGKTNEVRHNVAITVEGNKIESVGAVNVPAANPDGTGRPFLQTVDLSNATCLPGLIDTHTHILLQGDIIVDYDEQLLKESAAYRAIRGVAAAKMALEHGFTSIRDLETEGAGYTDADLKKAINLGIVPGPRMLVVTRALNVTGAYALLGYNWEYDFPHGVQVCDGPDGCRKAVREQISNGADWIKVYADQRTFQGPGNEIHSRPTFTLDELKAIVDEAHRERHKVAAHASAEEGAHVAVEAGVDSVEHGNYIAEADLKTMAAKGIWYVPTPWLSEYRMEQFPEQKAAMERSDMIYADTFKRARAAGVKIAYGTDAGAFEWTITPAMQFATLVRYGFTPMQAIQSATSVASQLFGWENQVGTIEPGKFADIVAVDKDPLQDIRALEKMEFVMKDGVVVKNETH
jgi:imidazolonepropionase-like amidohydrolase